MKVKIVHYMGCESDAPNMFIEAYMHIKWHNKDRASLTSICLYMLSVQFKSTAFTFITLLKTYVFGITLQASNSCKNMTCYQSNSNSIFFIIFIAENGHYTIHSNESFHPFTGKDNQSLVRQSKLIRVVQTNCFYTSFTDCVSAMQRLLHCGEVMKFYLSTPNLNLNIFCSFHSLNSHCLSHLNTYCSSGISCSVRTSTLKQLFVYILIFYLRMGPGLVIFLNQIFIFLGPSPYVYYINCKTQINREFVFLIKIYHVLQDFLKHVSAWFFE